MFAHKVFLIKTQRRKPNALMHVKGWLFDMFTFFTHKDSVVAKVSFFESNKALVAFESGFH